MWSKVLKWVLCSSAVLLAVHVVIFVYVAESLTQPERRVLQPYHHEWLEHPNQHGMQISKHITSDKTTPFLVVSPDQHNLGKRGHTIQRQLRQKGYAKNRFQAENGIVVLLHGRHGRKEDLLPVAERFAAAGFYSVLPDLPAHGDSPFEDVNFATTAFEKNIANNVLTKAKARINKPNLPAYIWGMSMGGAFANAAVSEKPHHWQGMVIVSSFDSLEITLRKHLYFLPLRVQKMYLQAFQRVMDQEYHLSVADALPETWAKNITIPVLVVHGDADEVIDISQGQRLYDAYASQQKKWLTVPTARHQNVLVTDMPLYVEMVDWFYRARQDVD